MAEKDTDTSPTEAVRYMESDLLRVIPEVETVFRTDVVTSAYLSLAYIAGFKRGQLEALQLLNKVLAERASREAGMYGQRRAGENGGAGDHHGGSDPAGRGGGGGAAPDGGTV